MTKSLQENITRMEAELEESTLQRDKYVVINNTTGHSFAVGDIVSRINKVTTAGMMYEYINNKGYQQELRCSEVQKIVNPEYLDASLDDTPCGKLGYKAGDLFVVAGSRLAPIGTVVLLTHDDTTDTPRFDSEDNYYFLDLDNVVKINK